MAQDSFRMSKGKTKHDLLQGTLDLMVLRTLQTLGSQHGFGLAKRILQISDGLLDLNQGTLYPALLRLEQRGWIRARWGTSENNRRARFYELTGAGRRQIDAGEPDSARTGGRVRSGFTCSPSRTSSRPRVSTHTPPGWPPGAPSAAWSRSRRFTATGVGCRSWK